MTPPDLPGALAEIESLRLRVESLERELAKPEDVRLREVLDALEGRAVVFDSLGDRVRWLLRELDEWIERAGKAEREVRAVGKLLEENGCECPCDHHPDERGTDCEVCLACRIGEALREESKPENRSQNG